MPVHFSSESIEVQFGKYKRCIIFVPVMANTKNALKAMRQANKRREQNRLRARTTRNAVRDLRTITGKAEANKKLPEVFSLLDKLAKRNIIHKKKADNLKSGLMKKAASMA